MAQGQTLHFPFNFHILKVHKESNDWLYFKHPQGVRIQHGTCFVLGEHVQHCRFR